MPTFTNNPLIKSHPVSTLNFTYLRIVGKNGRKELKEVKTFQTIVILDLFYEGKVEEKLYVRKSLFIKVHIYY